MRSPNARDQKWKSFSLQKQLYTLAVILLAVLFFYFLHTALYHCPKNNVNQEKGKEGNQTGVTNPI